MVRMSVTAPQELVEQEYRLALFQGYGLVQPLGRELDQLWPSQSSQVVASARLERLESLLVSMV